MEAALARMCDRGEMDERAGGSGSRDGDADLVARSAGGDATAFRVLLDRHLGLALGIARRMLRDDAEAEDVAQEAMLRLWRTGDGLDVGESGVRPWLARVVSNLCIDRMRRSRWLSVVEEVPEQSSQADQFTALAEQDLSARVGEALQRLPERQRQALTLFHYEGLSQVDVGVAMGVSQEAVESLLARARRTLKGLLTEDWQELLSEPGDA